MRVKGATKIVADFTETILSLIFKDKEDKDKKVVKEAENKAVEVTPDVQISDINKEKILKGIKERTATKSVGYKVSRDKTTVFGSKLGGVSYLPSGFSYPSCKGDPMVLLAQINFEEVPKIENYPESGILQIYVSYTHGDAYGVNFDDYKDQTTFRVVYHKDIQRDESLLEKQPVLEDLEIEDLPFEGSFKITFDEAEEVYISPEDFRFDDLFDEICESILATKVSSIYNLGQEEYEYFHEVLSSSGHKIGGYPFFTQQDPRDNDNDLGGHTIMLLQIDSEYGEHNLMWGDAGVANFFIKPEDLKNLDFSNVLYTWDCC